jgi:GH15 family glucan-1,4-alpha-glucosidase
LVYRHCDGKEYRLVQTETGMMPATQSVDSFRPLTYLDGYLPIEDHGLIGDGTTAALVGLDGTIDWLCLPRFDGAPVFCSILDRNVGGAFRIDAGPVRGARHRYLGDTTILITELELETGVLRITDLMPLRDNANLGVEGNPNTGELMRCVEVVDGYADVTVSLTVRGGIDPERNPDGIRLRPVLFPEVDLILESSRPLDRAEGHWRLGKGESVTFCLRWNGGVGASSVDAPVAAVTNTIEAWLSWLKAFDYHGPQRNLVRRSAITIKMLDYMPNGAMVAAPTSSLPEHIGGPRNWDYRYVWVRDASFTVKSLREIGLVEEAAQFLIWALNQCKDQTINVMYTLDGDPGIPELIDPDLEGYRGSGPVRWGNGASGQIQHDVYGELVDCAFQWATGGGELDESIWSQLRWLIDQAAEKWDKPDQGIWEVRSTGRVQSYSAGICQVALNRGARLAREFGFEGDIEHWDRTADLIQRTILEDAWCEQGQYLAQGFKGGHLDAAILALPLRRVIPADHPRMISTTEAIERELGAGDGLLYRYLTDVTPDGVAGGEGAFVLCSFWMIENLVLQGRLEEALERFNRMCSRTNALGLLPEQIDPGTGRFLGNFPQAFSHLGLISSGVALWNASRV